MSAKVINQTLDKKQIPVLPLLLVTILLLGSVIFFWTRISAEETRINETWSEYAAAKYSSGRGTSDDPYIIAGAEELALLSRQVNEGVNTEGVYYELACDIELDDHEWMPIGYSKAFKGTLDGNGCLIRKMHVAVKKGVSNYGLFGINEGTLVDLRIGNSDINLAFDKTLRGWLIKKNLNIGLLAGVNRGAVSNCSIRGDANITGAKDTTFGFVCGKNEDAVLKSVLSEGEIYIADSEMTAIGGLAGSILGSSFVNYCSYEGKFKYANAQNKEYYIGGLVGTVEGEGTTFCECTAKSSIYSETDTNAADKTGGFVGNSKTSAIYEKCVSICKYSSEEEEEYRAFAAAGQYETDRAGYYSDRTTLVLLDSGLEVNMKKPSERRETYRKTLRYSTEILKWKLYEDYMLPQLQVDRDSFDCRLLTTEKALVVNSRGKLKLFRYGVYDEEFAGSETVDGKNYYFKRGMVADLKE